MPFQKLYFKGATGDRLAARLDLPDDREPIAYALFAHCSPVDHIVGIDNATQVFQAAQYPKSFISLDQADYLLSHQSDSLYVGSLIAAWARRYFTAG